MLTLHGRIDRAGRLVFADPVLARLHEEAGGVPNGAVVVPQIAALVQLATDLGTPVERPVLVADGPITRELMGQAQPDPSGVDIILTGWDNIVPPLAFAAPGEAASEFDYARLEADGAWVTDADLKITRLAAGLDRDIGFLPATARGSALTRVFRLMPDPAGDFPILAALAKAEAFQEQSAELVPDNNRAILLSARPLFDGAGMFSGLVGSFNYVGLDMAQVPVERVQEADLDRILSERLESALRHPIARIIEGADNAALQVHGPLRQDYVRYARDIAGAARHLLDLLGDLSNLQAIEQPDFAIALDAVDLKELVGRATGLMRVRLAEKQIRLKISPNPMDAWAQGDFGRILQILVNLLSNAVRYSPEAADLDLGVVVGEETVSLFVSDTGKGIAAEDQERIFGKFERLDPTEAGGSGLGLYISRQLARAMGGDLTVESAPGQGARFCLSLRRALPLT